MAAHGQTSREEGCTMKNMIDDHASMYRHYSSGWKQGAQSCGRRAFRGDAAPPWPRCPLNRLALFLDVDGTLAPITARPEQTRVPRKTRNLLLALQSSGVALAALSGRPLTQVRSLLRPIEIPLAGSHGAQISPAQGRCIRSSGFPPAGLADRLQRGVERLPGVWLERKPSAFALHWRQAPQHRAEVSRLVEQALCAAPGWRLVAGHCVHELRPAGRDKGVALRRLMRQPQFAGCWPLAIGDDRTDEDAFVAALRLGGGAIRIGACKDTAAPWVLPDVGALAAWLQRLLRAFSN